MGRLAVALLLLLCPAIGSAQFLGPTALAADPTVELRQCGEPKRDADGTIHRSSAVTAAFRALHPCPKTGKHTGACPRWAINHIIPLAKGGCDSVINMMWLPVEIKSCSSPYCVDRWERTYWGNPYGIVLFPADLAASELRQ